VKSHNELENGIEYGLEVSLGVLHIEKESKFCVQKFFNLSLGRRYMDVA